MRQSATAIYSAAPNWAATGFANSGHSRSPLQARLGSSPQQPQKAATIQRWALQRKGGLPDGLEAAMEQIAGPSLDGVWVPYYSHKPAQANALAYAQGTNIYLGPGQERHLPPGAWHIVQQKQGRVRPTIQVTGVAMGDNPSLERAADMMGLRAGR